MILSLSDCRAVIKNLFSAYIIIINISSTYFLCSIGNLECNKLNIISGIHIMCVVIKDTVVVVVVVVAAALRNFCCYQFNCSFPDWLLRISY